MKLDSYKIDNANGTLVYIECNQKLYDIIKAMSPRMLDGEYGFEIFNHIVTEDYFSSWISWSTPYSFDWPYGFFN